MTAVAMVKSGDRTLHRTRLFNGRPVTRCSWVPVSVVWLSRAAVGRHAVQDCAECALAVRVAL